jgi:hypothetical protein
MNTSWIALSQRELLTELASVERAIARSRTFRLCTDEAGESHLEVSPELVALAQREHQIVTELRRRRPGAALAA